MDYKIIDLPRHLDRRGNLSVVENGINIPFDMKRVFFIYDVPGGESRAGHAHHTLYQFVIAVSGSFTVHLDDGAEKVSILLNKPYEGLLVPPGTWSHLVDFSSGAVALVLASDFYDESDYVRDYEEFIKLKKNGEIS
ncbi:MAG: FdtA/QdtA family cupin domain-containing protein [Muribaculaceae bacterium]|nr:FdtA/QdtA family cupin domain-containing protein [Muribaculaceae bacterium]